MEDIATAEPLRQDERGAVQKFRSIVLVVGGLLATSVAAMGQDNLPLAIGFVLIVIGGVVAVLLFDKQARECKRVAGEQAREISGWRREHKKCTEDLHESHILIALLYMICSPSAELSVQKTSHERRKKDRRERAPAPDIKDLLRSTIGPDRVDEVLAKAQRLLLQASG